LLQHALAPAVVLVEKAAGLCGRHVGASEQRQKFVGQLNGGLWNDGRLWSSPADITIAVARLAGEFVPRFH
jgi:hypothetical protein